MVEDVESILQQEFCCYGYKNVWDELKQKGYIINLKKVYHLMKIDPNIIQRPALAIHRYLDILLRLSKSRRT